MRKVWVLGLAVAVLGVSGCRGRFIDARITNDTDEVLKTVEVDYPGGSFGTSTLAAHGNYSYHFKALGTGVLQMSFVDAGGVSHQLNGPEVRDALAGELSVRVAPGGHVQWVLRPR